METEVEKKINADKDELIDLAMYRFWEYNQNVDISFMEDEAEGLLARWKIRLEEEKELLSVTASGVVAELDDAIVEVSSQSLKMSRSEASIAAEIEDMVRTSPTEAAPLTDAPIETAADQVPEGAISTAEDAPSSQA